MNVTEKKRRIVVLGATGMLGRALVKRLRNDAAAASGDIAAFSSADLDITRRGELFERLHREEPSIVINAAGYTDVDGCEANIDRAMEVNGDGPGHVADGCRECGATVIHLSTDYVFDGTSNRPYREDDAAHPLSAYGRSKWKGEEAVRASGCAHLIVRTSWLFGVGGRNFVEAVVTRAESGQLLRVVDDQIGRPTLATDLAEAIVRLIRSGARGTIHCANEGSCTWFAFAREIVHRAGFAVAVEPIISAELNRPAPRPAYSVLDTRKYTALTGHTLPPWKEALSRYLSMRAAAVSPA